MSRLEEERRLLRTKAQNVLDEAVRAVEKEKTDLEVETNIEFVGKINPVGPPGITTRFQEGKKPAKPAKCWRQSKENYEKAYNEKLEEQLIGVWKRFTAICSKYEVSVGAVIRQDGAQIGYSLTPAKQKSLQTVVRPPMPIPPPTQSKPEVQPQSEEK